MILHAPSVAIPPPVLAARCLALTSADANRRFVVGPELRREVVLVPDRMGDADARALGLALRAEVRRDGERWRVGRTAEQARAVRAEDVAFLRDRASAIVAGVETMSARYPASPSGGYREAYRAAKSRFVSGAEGPYDYSTARAEPTLPAARLLAEILKSAPDAALAQAAPGVTTVFSNDPVGEERPLPVSPRAIEAYVARQSRFAGWAQGAGQSQIEESDRADLPAGPPRLGSRTLLLEVERGVRETSFSLRVYDERGAVESRAFLTPSSFSPPSPPRAGGLKAADLPPEVFRSVAEATPGDPAFRVEALDPDAHDPLDGEARAALLLYARAKGYDRVLGCVPDGVLRAVRGATRDGRVDLDALGRSLPGLGVEELAQGGTLVLRPMHPALEEALRTDRRPLAAEYRAAVRGEFGTEALLGLHAAYAREWGERWMLDTEEAILARAFHLDASPNWGLPHAMLAAVGGLAPEGRARLAAGETVPLEPSASQAAGRRLAEFAESQAAMLRMLSREGGTASVPFEVQARDPGSALALEPTRLLAGGGVRLSARATTPILVRRIFRRRVRVRSYDPSTGEITERTGEGLVLDRDYRPLDDDPALKMGLLPERMLAMLDRGYLFLWSQESQFTVTATIANAYRVGPVVLREPPLRQSEKPVPLSEVPGVGYHPKGP